MKNYNKGFIVPLLLAIIAILVVGGGAYIYLNKNESKIAQTILTNLSTTTSSTKTIDVIVPTVVVIQSLNGSFVGTDTWTTTDMAGRKWTINYKDALYFDKVTATKEIPGDLNVWLKLAKQELTPGDEGPGPHLPVKVIGTIKDDILYASKIVQTIQ